MGLDRADFLTGVIAGPNRNEAPKDIPEWERFIRAWGTIAYHEMLFLVALLAVLYFGWGLKTPLVYGLLRGFRRS